MKYHFFDGLFLRLSDLLIDMGKTNRLTLYILIAMVVGVLTGWLINQNASPKLVADFSSNIKLLSNIFIRLVQMIIAPLVFTTLVVGIAKLGDLKTVGRVGGKAILWFITASLISLLIGLLLVNYFKPGQYIDLSHADTAGLADLKGKTQSFSLQNFVEHVIPKSFVEAMANNEMLQLVVFSVFFWSGCSIHWRLYETFDQGIGSSIACYFKNGELCNEFCTNRCVWCYCFCSGCKRIGNI